MQEEQDLSQESLRIRRLFRAPRDLVFRAWTNPEALTQWFGPPGVVTRMAEVDLRVGGRYRLGIQPTLGGELIYLSGLFIEVTAPERLVYTWAYEADPAQGETQVTVEFVVRGEATEVVLTHVRFLAAEHVANHRKGWAGCLDYLERYVATHEAH